MILGYLIILICSIIICHGEHQYFLKEPEDITVVAGDTVTLPCKVAHKQGLLQWTKDGFGLGVSHDLPGYPTYTMVGKDEDGDWNLEISSVTIVDDAVYQCQVGAHGDDPPIRSRPARLTVMVPPGLPRIKQGEVIDIVEGVETVVECTSSGGRPAGEIVWRDEDGKEILTNMMTESKKLPDMKTFETTSVLRLKPTKEDDHKKIFCSVSNYINTSPISTMTLLRLKYKPIAKLSYENEPLNEGDSFTVTCQAEAYPEYIEYTWYLNGEQINQEDRKKLTIPKLTRNHQNGMLECQASNSVGMSKVQATINFKYGPTMLLHPNSARVKEGETINLSCRADGSPTPRYVWTKTNSNEAIGFSQHLALVATAQTTGEYRCQAMVEGFPPVVSNPAIVSIITKPTIHSAQEQFGKLGGRVRLECRVASVSDDNYVSWNINGIPISTEDPRYDVTVTDNENEYVSELFIKKADTSDFVNYGCKATNEIGSDYLVITLGQVETGGKFQVLYIVIIIFTIVILVLILILCIILAKRKNITNIKQDLEDPKNSSNEKEMMKKYESSNDDDEVSSKIKERQMGGPDPDLILPLKKANKLPRNLLSDDEDDHDIPPHYILTPLDEESQIYSKTNKPYMIQRFENQSLASNPSFSSIDFSPTSSSLNSANSDMEPPQFRPMPKESTNESGKHFRGKNVHVSLTNHMFAKPANNAKANMKYTLEEDDDDDQYVTLLPAAHTIV